VHDSHNIHLASRIYGLRATDLNQGVVYGIHTAETERDDRLLTRFDYDEQFGTALNRFCVQAVLGCPLTVYGQGEQRRGFLNIRDTMRCIELAALNPPGVGEFRVFNQFTELLSVRQIAETIARDYPGEVTIEEVENPRVEQEDHYYNPRHTALVDLGLSPTLLSSTLIDQLFDVVERHKDRVDLAAIMPTVRWTETSSRLPRAASELAQAK
jgi:UDP-sulfoquinovose synthase